MSVPYWKEHAANDEPDRHEPARAVDEQHALPVGQYWTPQDSDEAVAVDEVNPLPVQIAASEVVDYGITNAKGGRLFGCHWGSVTTPLATAATTAIVAARPMAWIRFGLVGRAIAPVNFEIEVESHSITTQGEIAIAITSNDVGDGTSAAGTSGPLSLAPNSGFTSIVTQRQLATGDVTAEVGYLELKRFSFAASAVNQHFSWNARSIGVQPYLRNAGSLLAYIGGNAVNFYAQAQWWEY